MFNSSDYNKFASDVIIIPKSLNVEHMKANLDVFDFKRHEEDMVAMEALDGG